MVEGREITISNPRKVLFPDAGYTKLDVVQYYLAVGAARCAPPADGPMCWCAIRTVFRTSSFFRSAPRIEAFVDRGRGSSFPSGREAEEVVPRDAAALTWMANLACLELHPHPVRADDLHHPDELRVDLDPVPGVAWAQIREVARVVQGR